MPTALRAALQPALGYSVPFATFYPAVLLVGLGGGWLASLVVLAIAAAIGNYLFIPPIGTFSGQPQEVAATAVFLVTSLLIIVTAETLRRTVMQLDRTLMREAALRLELSHRVKNTLTIIQGLSHQIARTTADPQAFHTALSDRLAALGAAHSVLSTGERENCNLPALVKEALGPFHAEGSISVRGPTCLVPPASCVPLVMALHELGTNAVKYGALSTPRGWVEIEWRLVGGGESQKLHVTWQEHDGPPVQPPSRRGLGSRLLRPQGGLDDVRLLFEPTGVHCELAVKDVRTAHPEARAAKQDPAIAPDG